ncbi:MAG: cobaltochelatase subunit CobN, partial [Candidatus Methanomethylophilaceae archaeon]|nr:cobaltochelatase subunit CobN [Candidatus Methanomethylophilaceae archaeon]
MPGRILAHVWNNHKAVMDRISGDLRCDVRVLCPTIMQNENISAEEMRDLIRQYDAVLICWQNKSFFEQVFSGLETDSKIISIGSDPAVWTKSNVDMKIVSGCYEYMIRGGDENFRRMFDFIDASLMGGDEEIKPPVEVPWQAIVGFRDGELFQDPEEYIGRYGLDRNKPFIGIASSRAHYTMDGLSTEKEMCRLALEYGMNPILVYTMYRPEREQKVLSPPDCIRQYMYSGGKPLISALVKLSIAGFSEDFLKELGVPVFAPVMMSRMSVREWRESSGLTTDVAWKIILPETEGAIEPIPIGSEMDWEPRNDKKRVLIEERCRKVLRRIKKTIDLQKTPCEDKKVLIFLNNFPCHGAEANIGNAGGLNALESTARILQRLKSEGYSVTAPADGKELRDMILEKKAMNEFRWTTVQEIKRCGGTLYEMETEEYEEYLKTLPEGIPEDIKRTWGEPPGESMVLDDKILISGIRLGNAVVALEPKRGCYGPKCDGKVCRILQDPECAPTHQFMAEMHYFNDIWKADIMIHVGSHGCMEFLPGKGAGLSERCYPDICMGDTPHIYIYTTDNPSEGLVAKRRSYATIISHMQNPVKDVELYGDLAEMDSLLRECQTAKDDPSRCESLRNSMIEKFNSVSINRRLKEDSSIEECVRAVSLFLSGIRSSQTTRGLHVFGDIPAGDERAEMVYSIMKYCDSEDSLMSLIAKKKGYDIEELFSMQPYDEIDRKTADDLLAEIRSETLGYISDVFSGKDAPDYGSKKELVKEISNRIADSDEMGSLIACMSGKFIPPSPSGFITRGRYDVLPTGRNFYSSDPRSVPTRSAWETGVKLAEATLKRYQEEEGRLPETIGFNWTFTDLIVCGGETMSQIMYLLGAEPVREKDGTVRTFRILSLEELGRPRIDMTVNVSTMLVDNMPGPMDYFDSVLEKIMDLDEGPDCNYPRKHMLESVSEGIENEEARTRMFGNGPGCGSGGLYLAILASAWKDEKDLTDYYLSCKGYGYGGKRKGKAMLRQFAGMLSRNDITFDKVHSDSVDILSSGRYSGVGGMAAAARFLSGKEVKTYYGDTSNPLKIPVRSFSEEVERVMNTKVLNPQWIDAMKEAGYNGASEMTKRITRIYGWQCATRDVDCRVFDGITDKYVRDEDNYKFLKENNIYAAGELVRRLLEASERKLWDASEED